MCKLDLLEFSLNAPDVQYYNLLHGSSQCRGMLRSLAWALHNFAVNARYKLTAVKENKGLFAYNDVFGITPQVVR